MKIHFINGENDPVLSGDFETVPRVGETVNFEVDASHRGDYQVSAVEYIIRSGMEIQVILQKA